MGNLYLNGHTCLECGKGWYDGYLPGGKFTAPCNECGHIGLAVLPVKIFRLMAEARDIRLGRRL